MNKQEQQGANGDRHPKTGLTSQTITETMEHPGFGHEQLPKLWQQIENNGKTPRHGSDLFERWNEGLDTMYRRCETYLQHIQLSVVLSGLSPQAWHGPLWKTGTADNLIRHADPGQLQQAIKHERPHPHGWWPVTRQILRCATAEQLTGQVVEQLRWDERFLAEDLAWDKIEQLAENKVLGARPTTPEGETPNANRGDES